MKEFIDDLLFRGHVVLGILAWMVVISGLFTLWTLTRLLFFL